MSNELIEKVIQTSSIGDFPSGGGLLSPDQADRFIDDMWNATVLGGSVRKVPMRANEVELDRIAIGERLVRLATEAVDDGVNVGVAFSKITLTTRKLRLDWEISAEALEDNIEGAGLEDHIAGLMAVQAANDLEDLAINGDVSLTADPLLKSFDGWAKLGRENGHVVSAGGDTLTRDVLYKAVSAMPRTLMNNRASLRMFTSSGAVQNFQRSLEQAAFSGNGYVTPQQARAIDNGFAGSDAGWTVPGAFGFNLTEVPLFAETRGYDDDEAGAGTSTNDHTELWFVNPKNLIWGVKREIKVTREYVNKKDTIEHTLFTRVGTAVENEDAFVVVTDIKVTV